MRVGPWEQWVIRRPIEPFARLARARLPEAGGARRILLEQPAAACRYNLGGCAFGGGPRALARQCARRTPLFGPAVERAALLRLDRDLLGAH